VFLSFFGGSMQSFIKVVGSIIVYETGKIG
jgi:hypothetical protein